MRADWPAAECILCLEQTALCEEHLIPRVLGGSLTCSFLCRSCNSRFGSEIDAAAKSDPSILVAVGNLHDEIPYLSRRLIESHPHLSTGKGPRVSGSIQEGAFRVRPQGGNDGSLILPTSDARKAIAKILKRDGYDQAPIKHALETFDEMPENRQTPIAPGLEAVKWSVEGIELDLSQSKVLDARLPAKVAFEFLALCTGEAICSNDWPLPELRRILATGIGEDDTILRVEHFRAGDPRPFHGICIEENPMYAQVQVRLFGCLAYCVHFPQLYIGGPRYAYTHCLETRHEDVSIIGGEALSR